MATTNFDSAEEFAKTEQKIDKNYSWSEIADFPALLQKAEGAGKQP